MKIHILKDTTTEGLEAKINQVAEEAQGAINNIQYQAVAVPFIYTSTGGRYEVTGISDRI